MNMAEWARAGAARNEFADMIARLRPEQLEQQSLCDAWTARGVLCHVTGFVETGALGMIGGMFKSGFNFDKMSISMADKQLARPVGDVIATLRAKAAQSALMPGFPEEMTMADVAIHTQDVRRPLALSGAPSEETIRSTLDFITTHKMGTTLIAKRPPLDGVKLVATDMDWSFGEGAEISGPGESLMMALAVRPVLDELSGDGVDLWR